eukprot:12627745-Prorocentrum_lima.AAC.1
MAVPTFAASNVARNTGTGGSSTRAADCSSVATSGVATTPLRWFSLKLAPKPLALARTPRPQ